MNKLFLILFFLIYSISSCSNEIMKNLSNYKEAYGYVKGVTGNKYIYYKIGDQSYKYRFDHTYYGELQEEKYLIKYDTLDPKKIVIDYTKPIFLETEKTDFCEGKITKIVNYRWPFGKAFCVRFEYVIRGVEVEREQEIPIDYEKFSKLREGNIVKVEYWLDHPQRAILRYE